MASAAYLTQLLRLACIFVPAIVLARPVARGRVLPTESTMSHIGVRVAHMTYIWQLLARSEYPRSVQLLQLMQMQFRIANSGLNVIADPDPNLPAAMWSGVTVVWFRCVIRSSSRILPTKSASWCSGMHPTNGGTSTVFCRCCWIAGLCIVGL